MNGITNSVAHPPKRSPLVTRKSQTKPSLYGRDGRRKYLTPAERRRFIRAAEQHQSRVVGTFCLVLAYTGCRISEALALTGTSIELEGGFIAIRSLKKRTPFPVIRQVPVPGSLLKMLNAQRLAVGGDQQSKLWNFSRTHAWQVVKEVLANAGIENGPNATAKGLRHAFGVHAIQSGVPINLVQRWLGHAAMSTTAIYLDVVGNEERQLAKRMWS